MKISCEPKNVRLTDRGNILALASITLDNAFVVSGLRVMDGAKGLFVQMPSQKGTDSEGNVKYYDTAFPLNKELRGEINSVVLDAYQGKLNELQQSAQKRDETPQQSESTPDEEDIEDNGPEMY